MGTLSHFRSEKTCREVDHTLSNVLEGSLQLQNVAVLLVGLYRDIQSFESLNTPLAVFNLLNTRARLLEGTCQLLSHI